MPLTRFLCVHRHAPVWIVQCLSSHWPLVRIQKGQLSLPKCFEGSSKDRVIPETLKSSDNVFLLTPSSVPVPHNKQKFVMGWPWLAARLSQLLSSLAGQEEKMREKNLWFKIRTGRWLASHSSQAKQTWQRFICCQLKAGSDGDKTNPNLKPLYSHPLFFPGSSSLLHCWLFCLLLVPSGTVGWELQSALSSFCQQRGHQLLPLQGHSMSHQGLLPLLLH